MTTRKVSAEAYPKVWRIEFRFGEPEPINRHFVDGDIALSHMLANFPGTFAPGEESFMRSVRRFPTRSPIRCSRSGSAGFIGQEAVHGQQHRQLNEKLIEKGYPNAAVPEFRPEHPAAEALRLRREGPSRQSAPRHHRGGRATHRNTGAPGAGNS
jgi:predicted metal-dependent hydrolase